MFFHAAFDKAHREDHARAVIERAMSMGEKYDIDIAFLPVNQPYTMTVDQCVNAARVIGPKVLIPYHFSATDLSALPSQLPGITILLRQMQ